MYSSCRIEETRTPDPYVPNVVRYQLRYYPMASLCENRCKVTNKNANSSSVSHFFLFLACEYGIFCLPLHPQTSDGAIAQLVEQRTENPCVPGSIPGGTTQPRRSYSAEWLLLLFSPYLSRQSKALGLSINWPCVPGSIPGGTTQHRRSYSAGWLLLLFSPYLSQCAALPIAAHCIRHRSVLRSSMQRAACFHGLCSLGDACSPASCHQAAKRAMRARLGEISVVQACLYQYFSLTLWGR